VTAWEGLPVEVRADVRRAAMTNLVDKLVRVERLLLEAPLEEHDNLISRRQRLQRALDAAKRLP
jgi:hypothetical protein